MNNDRQKILTDYISYLYTTSRTYDTIGKYIKYVTDFLEVVILCLSLLIVIPILMVIWIDWEQIESKRRNRWE